MSFEGQTLEPLDLDTGVDISTGSTTTKEILYRRPDGTTGKWAASSVQTLTVMRYEFGAGTAGINMRGEWRFQAHWVTGGKHGYGDFFYTEFLTPLPSV